MTERKDPPATVEQLIASWDQTMSSLAVKITEAKADLERLEKEYEGAKHYLAGLQQAKQQQEAIGKSHGDGGEGGE